MAKKHRLKAAGEGTRNSMELLLAEDVPALGKQGEIVKVKPGYARNFLVPQGLATVATAENKKMVDRHRQRLAQLEVERLKALRETANAIGKYSVTLEANANPEGHLYGSIVAVDICKSLQTAGYKIESDHIRLDGPLKELGMYTVKIQLHPEVSTEVKVWVVPAASKQA